MLINCLTIKNDYRYCLVTDAFDCSFILHKCRRKLLREDTGKRIEALEKRRIRKRITESKSKVIKLKVKRKLLNCHKKANFFISSIIQDMETTVVVD